MCEVIINLSRINLNKNKKYHVCGIEAFMVVISLTNKGIQNTKKKVLISKNPTCTFVGSSILER